VGHHNKVTRQRHRSLTIVLCPSSRMLLRNNRIKNHNSRNNSHTIHHNSSLSNIPRNNRQLVPGRSTHHNSSLDL
jgi:hypothetical protein